MHGEKSAEKEARLDKVATLVAWATHAFLVRSRSPNSPPPSVLVAIPIHYEADEGLVRAVGRGEHSRRCSSSRGVTWSPRDLRTPPEISQCLSNAFQRSSEAFQNSPRAPQKLPKEVHRSLSFPGGCPGASHGTSQGGAPARTPSAGAPRQRRRVPLHPASLAPICLGPTLNPSE